MDPVRRSDGGAVSKQFGVVGALIGMAVSGFECTKCGPIPRSEFPPDVRSEMARGSVLMVAIAFVVLGGVIALLVALNS
jgi:hypothetical protein